MCPKSSRRASATLKRVHHIMRAQKFGAICLTIQKVIFGPWGAFCMRCVPLFLRLELMTCKAYTKRSSKANIQESQSISVRKWQQLSNSCSRFLPLTGPAAIKFSLCQLLNLSLKSSSRMIQSTLILRAMKKTNKRCSKPSG